MNGHELAGGVDDGQHSSSWIYAISDNKWAMLCHKPLLGLKVASSQHPLTLQKIIRAARHPATNEAAEYSTLISRG